MQIPTAKVIKVSDRTNPLDLHPAWELYQLEEEVAILEKDIVWCQLDQHLVGSLSIHLTTESLLQVAHQLFHKRIWADLATTTNQDQINCQNCHQI